MNIANNEESFIALIQKVFTKEFTKQAKHITNRISSNLSITNWELRNLRNEISELKLSREFTENVLNEKMAIATSQVKKLENYLENVEREITELQYDFDDTQ